MRVLKLLKPRKGRREVRRQGPIICPCESKSWTADGTGWWRQRVWLIRIPWLLLLVSLMCTFVPDPWRGKGSLAWLACNGKARLTLTVRWVRLLQKGLFLSGFIEFSLFCHL